MQLRSIISLFIVATFFSCKKTTESFKPLLVTDIFTYQVGKTFIYRYDSTFTSNFGTTIATKSFIAKDSVESSFLDAIGNPSFRIYRYLTDTLQSAPWVFASTIVATINNNNLETVENNFRFIKMASPVNNNFSWKGNIYINTQSQGPNYFYDNWDYRYSNLYQNFTVLKGTLDSTYTVLQQDIATPINFDASIYNEKVFSKEVYAKNIGLVYKEFLFYIWQPTPSPARFQDDAVGIKMNLIDYR
jgi:hypothetical protein